MLSPSLSKRACPYMLLALFAVSIALVPSILWQDFATPSPYWDVVERTPDRIVLQVNRAPAPPPGTFALEFELFKVLVAPTTVPSLLGVWRPEYTRLAFPDGIITEAPATFYPSALAFQYVRLAVPCWLVFGVLAYELTLVARRLGPRRPGRDRMSTDA